MGIFFKKSAHSNVSDRGVFHTSLWKGKCGYDGGNIRKEIIVSAWNWDRGSSVTVGSTLLGVNDTRFWGELNMAILYSALADQVSLSAMAWGVVPNGEQTGLTHRLSATE